MLAALLAFTLASPPISPGPRYTTRECMRQVRNSRGITCGSLALFEFAPAGGAGMGAACACAALTAATGQTLTFSRGSTGACLKSATAAIANGDLVTCSSNLPRVQPVDTTGQLGLLVESSRTNLNLQSGNLADAAYTSVGAPTVTANSVVGPDNSTVMTLIQDTSAVAQEGRAQTITVTAGTTNTLSVFVKAGTLTAVTLSLDGTTATCTGLSSVTATRCSVTDASASGVAISAQVLGGTVVGDTGTFAAWGQQVEGGTYATSYIATTAGTVTRAVDAASVSLGAQAAISAISTRNRNNCLNPGTGRAVTVNMSGAPTFEYDSQFGTGPSLQWLATTSQTYASALGWAVGAVATWSQSSQVGSTNRICKDGSCTTGGTAAVNAGGAGTMTVTLGNYSSGAFYCDGVVSQVAVDPTYLRFQ